MSGKVDSHWTMSRITPKCLKSACVGFRFAGLPHNREIRAGIPSFEKQANLVAYVSLPSPKDLCLSFSLALISVLIS